MHPPNKYEGEERRRKEPWHLDKRVPITVIIFLLAQTSSIIWYGAKFESRVEDGANRIAALEIWKENQNGTAAKTESRLAVIEERTAAQTQTLNHIDERLEKIIDQRQK